jgi:NADH-quinone oxidoreductase subunit J
VDSADVLILLTAILGGTGIYALLPRGTSAGRRVGAALTLIALVLLIPHWRGMGIASATVLFYLLAILTLVGAVMTVTSRNPVYCALWFGLVLLGTGGLFLLVGAQFLAAATVIVYAGAIVVTLLFIVMLAQQQGLARYDRLTHEPFLATWTSMVLVAVVLLTFVQTSQGLNESRPIEQRAAAGMLPPKEVLAAAQERQSPASRIETGEDAPPHVAQLGTAMFTDHLIGIEAVGALLLVALVGAAVIATRHRDAGLPPDTGEGAAQ